ncbi:methyltransferase [Paludisphaera sp.]|uniref:methyltransferase n=1 Tax=Paludisphaera sp. TaxID=2017432 RepID=UPI00301C8145
MESSGQSLQGRAFGVICGFWSSQTMLAAARLGVADHLVDGPRTAEELAGVMGAHAPSLGRLLKALVTLEALTAEGGRYGLTDFGRGLASGTPGSFRSMILGVMSDDHRRAWAELSHSVRTGETAFDHVHGVPVFEYYGKRPEASADFNAAMTSLSAVVEAALREAFDFSAFRKIIDVGGGNGGLLAAALVSAPRASGVLFDTPAGLAGAEELLKARGVAGRCERVAGDFFESVPAGGDLYVLKWILHDWDDRRAAVILRNCREAAGKGARILVIESVLPDGDAPSPGRLSDLNMMAMTGGRERSASEYRGLLEAAGFRDVRVRETGSPYGIVEAVAG